MHKIKLFILFTMFLTFGVGSLVLAQTANHTHCQRISISASSTPVQILPAVSNEASILINPEAAATVAILAFPYAGATVPAAVPSACASPTQSLNDGKGCLEITNTKPFSAATTCDAPNCNWPGDSWAAVVETTATETIDTCYTAPF